MSCEDNIVISCLRTSVPLTISWSSSWTCHLNICPLLTDIPYRRLLRRLLCESIVGHWHRSLSLSLSTLRPLQAALLSIQISHPFVIFLGWTSPLKPIVISHLGRLWHVCPQQTLSSEGISLSSNAFFNIFTAMFMLMSSLHPGPYLGHSQALGGQL